MTKKKYRFYRKFILSHVSSKKMGPILSRVMAILIIFLEDLEKRIIQE